MRNSNKRKMVKMVKIVKMLKMVKMVKMVKMTESMTNHSHHDEVQQKIRSTIPEDLIYEIMLRLPARSLVRFRCVSKSWLSIITCPSFITAHLQHKRLAHQTLMILDPNYMKRRRSITRFYLPSLDANINSGINLLELPPLKILRHCYFEYSCDGLMLLIIPMKGNYIINPLTGHFCILPRSRFTNFLAFYFHRPTSKYRLLADKDAYTTYVLDIGATKWRRIHDRLPAMALKSSLNSSFVDVHESLYCLAKMDPREEDDRYPPDAPPNIVMTFHKETEVYNLLPLPPSEELIGRGGGSLINFNGELGLWFVSDNGFIDFWIMKECWIKSYSVYHPNLEDCSKYISYEWNVGLAVSIKDEELLIGACRGLKQQLLVHWNLKTGACSVQNLKDYSLKFLIKLPYIEALTFI